MAKSYNELLRLVLKTRKQNNPDRFETISSDNHRDDDEDTDGLDWKTVVDLFKNYLNLDAELRKLELKYTSDHRKMPRRERKELIHQQISVRRELKHIVEKLNGMAYRLSTQPINCTRMPLPGDHILIMPKDNESKISLKLKSIFGVGKIRDGACKNEQQRNI